MAASLPWGFIALLFLIGQGSPQRSGEISEKPEPPVTFIREEAKTGLELWQTLLGRLWIPKPGADVIRHLQWEQVVEKVYDHPSARVHPGDIVIDCGAHIGGFTATSLRAGAKLVIAIEPEKANVAAFRLNFAEEIRSGRVKLVEKGVWDKTGQLALHISRVGDSHSVAIPQNGGADESISVTTLDAVADSLKLPRVDFIKMDIEGAEQNALRGARSTIARWKPRLAISSYHLKGDPAAICTLVWSVRPDYFIASKGQFKGSQGVVPKVLFFY